MPTNNSNFDVFRAISMFPAAMTYAMAIANLVVSYLVLRPKKVTWRTWWGSGAGFLWAHIVAVVLGFQGFVTWGVIEVVLRFGLRTTWRTPLLIVLCTILCIGYTIIFRIELSRHRMQKGGLAVKNVS